MRVVPHHALFLAAIVVFYLGLGVGLALNATLGYCDLGRGGYCCFSATSFG